MRGVETLMNPGSSTPEAFQFDKVPESKMAELLGTTKRALESKRDRGVIPEGVWKKIDGRIFYSIRRYEAWLDNEWDSQLGSNTSASQYESVSFGTASADPKRSRIPKPPRGSRRQQIYALK